MCVFVCVIVCVACACERVNVCVYLIKAFEAGHTECLL